VGLNLWFRTDIERILRSKAHAAMRQQSSAYRQGYMDALDDLAIEFGLCDSELSAGLSHRQPSGGWLMFDQPGGDAYE